MTQQNCITYNQIESTFYNTKVSISLLYCIQFQTNTNNTYKI